MIRKPRPVIYLLCLLAAMMAAPARADSQAAPVAAPASTPPALLPSSEKLLKSYLLGRNFMLGGAMAQDVLALRRTGDEASLTNGLTPELVAAFNSQTTPLAMWPLRDHGAVTLGYDYTVTGSFFSPDRQLINNATTGSNVGTRANAGFVAAAPRMTLAMGPLYASGPEIGWKCTLGLGLALMHYNGDAAFFGDNASGTHAISSGPALPAEYLEARLLMNFGHWDAVFSGQYLASQRQGYGVKYTIYSAGLAYQFALF